VIRSGAPAPCGRLRGSASRRAADGAPCLASRAPKPFGAFVMLRRRRSSTPARGAGTLRLRLSVRLPSGYGSPSVCLRGSASPCGSCSTASQAGRPPLRSGLGLASRATKAFVAPAQKQIKSVAGNHIGLDEKNYFCKNFARWPVSPTSKHH